MWARAPRSCWCGDEDESPDRAVYYPEDQRFLRQLEPGVKHYEVLSSPPR